MTISLDFRPLAAGDLRDLERLLILMRHKFAEGDPGHAAIRLLLLALDTHKAEGHRRPGAATVRIFTGQDDPELEQASRDRLVGMLQVARDADWLSDALRGFLNGLMIDLVDARTVAVAEADAIRQLYVSPASRNPREAA